MTLSEDVYELSPGSAALNPTRVVVLRNGCSSAVCLGDGTFRGTCCFLDAR